MSARCCHAAIGLLLAVCLSACATTDPLQEALVSETKGFIALSAETSDQWTIYAAPLSTGGFNPDDEDLVETYPPGAVQLVKDVPTFSMNRFNGGLIIAPADPGEYQLSFVRGPGVLGDGTLYDYDDLGLTFEVKANQTTYIGCYETERFAGVGGLTYVDADCGAPEREADEALGRDLPLIRAAIPDAVISGQLPTYYSVRIGPLGRLGFRRLAGPRDADAGASE